MHVQAWQYFSWGMAFSTALGQSALAHPVCAAHAHFAFPASLLVNATGHLCFAVLDLLSVSVHILKLLHSILYALCEHPALLDEWCNFQKYHGHG